MKLAVKVIGLGVLIGGVSIGSIMTYNKLYPRETMPEVVTDSEYKATVKSNQKLDGILKREVSGKMIVTENLIHVVHKTEYTEEIPVGMYGETIKAKATIIKYGEADVQYNYVTDLDKADIEETDTEVNIKLEKPYLDEKSVKIKPDSFKLDKSKSSISVAGKIKISEEILTNKSDTLDGRASRTLMNEIPKQAIKELKKDNNSGDKISLENAQSKLSKKLSNINTDKKINISYK